MAVAADLDQIITQSNISGVGSVDSTSGLQSSLDSLKSYTSLTFAQDGVYYNKALNTLVITKAGTTLDGYNFSGVSINVQADNVTFKNSYFDATSGSYAINAFPGTSNLTIENSTFDGLKLNNTSFNDFVASRGDNTVIQNNAFLNAPNDAITIVSGTISGNHIAGGGYATGAHSDAIWIGTTISPVVITDNVIDWRSSDDAAAQTNNAIRITGELGSVNDVLVTKNVILGGSATVLVSDGATQTNTAAQVGSVTDVRIVDNVIDYGRNGDLEQTYRPADMIYSNNLHASGKVLTPGIEAAGSAPDVSHMLKVVATTPTSNIYATAASTYLVGGSGTNAIYGGKGDDVIYGGAGRDYLTGGGGHNTYVYTSVSNSGIDLINDFTKGSDKIDLATLDNAPTSLSGWQWLGAQSFTGHAWQLRVSYATAGMTVIQLDTDGDLKADFQLQLKGVVDISNSDFILVDYANLVPDALPTMSGAVTGAMSAGSGAVVAGQLNFADTDTTDMLTTSITKQVVQYIDSLGVDRTSTLTGTAIAALEAGFSMPLGSLGSSSGSSVWSYAANNPALSFLGAGETAKITTTIQVDDGAGGKVSEAVQVTVTGVNDAPVLDNPGTVKVMEAAGRTGSAGLLSQQGAISFADADISDIHSVSVASIAGARGYKGTLTAAVTGEGGNDGHGTITWTFSATDKSFDYLAAGQILSQTYTITLTDNHGVVSQQNIQVDIVGTNDAPIICGSTSASWVEGSASSYLKTGTLLITDPDLTDHVSTALSGQSISLTSASGTDLTSHLSAAQISALESAFSIQTGDLGSNAGSSNWTFSADDKAFDFLGQNDILKLVNTVTASDDHGGVTTQDVVFTIRGINDAPVVLAASQVTGSVNETAHATGDASLHVASGAVVFSDADMSDTHSIRVVAKGSGYLGTFTPVILQDSQGGQGVISWTFQVADKALDGLGENQTVNQTYTLQISDGKGGTVSQDVTIALNGASDQFSFQSTAAKALPTFADGDTISINASAFGGGLAAGALNASFFSDTNASTTSAHGQFYQDASHTHLYWDADGTGSKAPIAIATFSQSHVLHSADILVI